MTLEQRPVANIYSGSRLMSLYAGKIIGSIAHTTLTFRHIHLRRSELEDGMALLGALPRVMRGGLVKAAKHCGAGLVRDASALNYPSQRCLFGNKRADAGVLLCQKRPGLP